MRASLLRRTPRNETGSLSVNGNAHMTSYGVESLSDHEIDGPRTNKLQKGGGGEYYLLSGFCPQGEITHGEVEVKAGGQ